MAEVVERGEIVNQFANLFKGRRDARGTEQGGCIREEITSRHYETHLDGKESLGIYPLLDDGTCYFFAIDIDEHDFDKAKAIRQELKNIFIPVYIAASRRKGYHIYGFAFEVFKAKEIRHVVNSILDKLAIKAEIFPKQSEVSPQVPLGNYINLPSFGFTRPFLSTDLREIKLDLAINKIKRVPQESIDRALCVMPQIFPMTVLPSQRSSKGRPKRKSSNAPCIDAILKGVSQPGRDEAAFALARHYLDQNFTEPEVLGVLQKWDIRNQPPLNDLRLLETKVRSASKGYAFGCNSIQDNPNLSSFCCGEEICFWLKALNAEKKKKGLIREQVFHETETHLYEQIEQNKNVLFAIYEKATGEVTYAKSIDYPDFTIIPVQCAELTEGVVFFPSGALDYGDTLKLKNELRDFIRVYVDMEEQDTEYCAWYIMGTWVYDRLNTVAYLRFLGDTGVGKSRALDTIAKLCFRALMLSGAVTPAPIYREIRRFRGTVILEEADFRESDEKSEVITILNCGIERGRAVLRCSGDDPNIIEVLPTFGPKVFATRKSFEDKALESRCYTCKMRETDRDDIPYELKIDPNFAEWSMELRNKLLLWRFRNYEHIAENIGNVDMGYIEPRLKQMGLPLAIPFMHLPEVMVDFRAFLQKRQRELIREREESVMGGIVRAIFEVAKENGKEWVSAGKVATHLSTEKHEVTPQKISAAITSLALKRTAVKARPPGGNTPAYHIIWDVSMMRTLLRRYVSDHEEFDELLESDMEV